VKHFVFFFICSSVCHIGTFVMSVCRNTGSGFPAHIDSIINVSTALCWALAPFFSFVILYTVVLLGRWISPSRGRYLYTEQHNHRIDAHRYPCLEWDSKPRPQSSSGLKHFVPQTARPLWSASNTHISRKSQEYTEKDMQKRKENSFTTGTSA
jgi:hypothetical protein